MISDEERCDAVNKDGLRCELVKNHLEKRIRGVHNATVPDEWPPRSWPVEQLAKPGEPTCADDPRCKLPPGHIWFHQDETMFWGDV